MSEAVRQTMLINLSAPPLENDSLQTQCEIANIRVTKRIVLKHSRAPTGGWFVASSDDNSSSAGDTRPAGAESVLGCALLVARRVRDPYLRGRALCSVVEGYVNLRDKKRAAKVLSEALRAAGDIKDRENKADLLFDISVKCSAAEDHEKALRAARRIGLPDTCANALAFIAGGHAEAGEYERAFETVEKITCPDRKAIGLSLIAVTYAERENKGEARRLLAQVFGTIGKDPEATDTDWALAEIVHHCTTVGLLREALRAVRRIKDRYWKTWATVRIADVYRKRGKIEKCQSKLHEVLKLSHSIKEAYRKVEAWTELSEAFAACEERETAARLLRTAFHSAARIHGFVQRYIGLSITAAGCIRHGDYDQALRVARKLRYYYSDEENLSSVAGAFAEAGRFDKGLKIAESIHDRRQRALALAGVASGFAKHGHLDQARWLARSIKHSEGKSDVFRRLAGIHLEAGRHLDALQSAKQIPSPHIQCETLATIAMEFIESGHIPGPEEIQVLEKIAEQRF